VFQVTKAPGRSFFLVFFAFLTGVLSAQSDREYPRELAAALQHEDLDSVTRIVQLARVKLGDQAGVPEVPDEYRAIPATSERLSSAEVANELSKALTQIERRRWWKVGLDPTKLEHALREPAAMIGCCLCLYRTNTESSDKAMQFAREAGDFLVWAQEQGGVGVYPFPTSTGNAKDNAFVAAQKYLQRAKREGRWESVVRNGWAIDDEGDGGLQFDNGESGVAMLELYEATHEKRYLESALRAADWAASRPLVSNWNYNSFSVSLLTKAYSVTRDSKYLDSAKKKAKIGVMPGQLTDGPNVGRWVDGHNARPAYHYIMLQSLASLAMAMPREDTDLPEVLQALRLGLKARNQDFVERGVTNKDHALQVLLFVQSAWSEDEAFLRDTHTPTALDALRRLVSSEARQGKSPTGPRAWGMFLLDSYMTTIVQYTRQESIEYGPQPTGTPPLTMDLFRPTQGANRAGVVLVVSGGWASSRGMINKKFAEHFLKRGYTVFAVVHRTHPQYMIPEIVPDVHRAVRFIRYRAGEYGIDKNRIGISGASSGGHLALMVATQGGVGNPNSEDVVDRESSSVQAAACFFPPTDFLNYVKPGIDALDESVLKNYQKFFGDIPSESETRNAFGRSISPIFFVSKTTAPTLLIHGDKDWHVRPHQSASFVDAVTNAGGIAKLIRKVDKAHGWPEMGEDVESFVDWFDEHLK
jgi:acetyl esterase/lipase